MIEHSNRARRTGEAPPSFLTSVKVTMIIYGAGMAGLLAGVMLSHHSPVIHEIQPELPDNHGALLRFRSRDVEASTGIPLREVNVTKAIKYRGSLHTTPTLAMNNLYSRKVTGHVMDRSVLNTSPVKRYIAPPDFLARLASRCDIQTGSGMTPDWIETYKQTHQPVISTIPMPSLMRILGWPKESERPPFRYTGIYSQHIQFRSPSTDIHQTIYYPEPNVAPYRVSVTGSVMIAEYTDEWGSDPGIDWVGILEDFGIHRSSFEISTPKFQKFGKILPIDENQRRGFILSTTDSHGIYSLGRFATWRQILLDDVVKDISIIDKFIRLRDGYTNRLYYAN